VLSLSCAVAQADCEGVPALSASEIETQLQDVQRQLAAVPEANRDKPEYRSLQERGLTLLEQLQCKREADAPREAVKRGPGVSTAFATIPILFITDRATLQTTDAAMYFGASRQAAGVTFGQVEVRMPAESFSAGDPVSAGIRMTSVEDSSEGISVTLPTLFAADKLSEKIAQYKAQLPAQAPVRVLLFIHGFNVSYRDSVQAAARLAWGLRLDVLPIAVTWPSQAKILRYWQDEQSIDPSKERLRPILQQLFSHATVDEVIVVAHSMGTRLTTRVLSDLELQKAPIQKLSRIAFAAADLNEEEIRELWPRLQPMPKKGWTIYTSSNDFALMASRIVHSRSPVGDSRDRVFTLPPADTVDASAVAPALRGYGHSYLIDNPLLQTDLRRWILPGAPVAQRGLKQETRPPATFWTITSP
jgi:esterase/lipase superfamily enzyme